MEAVKLVDGKFVKTGVKAPAGETKPPKYRYPPYQVESLLKIAKADGIDIGETKAKNTQAMNVMTGLVLDAFIADRTAQAKSHPGK